MNKIYSCLLVFMLAIAAFQGHARECKVTLDIDNPALVSAVFDGNPLELQAGSNTIVFEGEGYVKSSKIQVNAVGENTVIDVVSLTEGVSPGYITNGVQWEKWLYEDNDGNHFAITTKDMAALRTARCTIDVLDIGGGITASRGGHAFSLSEGLNEVMFDPESETDFVFTLSTWTSCHTFTVNGEPVEKTFYEYEVTLADGDEVVIAVYDPVNTVPVTISVNEGAEECVLVEVNHMRIDDWREFTMKSGEKLGITLDTENYNVKSFRLNGEEIGYSGYFSLDAGSEPVNIEISASVWGDLSFTVNCNIPGAVKMYYISDLSGEDGDSFTSDRYPLVEGENRLTMPERGARLVIVPRYGYDTEITDADGKPVEIIDNTVTDVYDGMVINLRSSELEYDACFAFFAYGTYGKNEISKPGDRPTADFDFGCYAHAWSEDWTDIDHSGYTIVPFITSHDISWLMAFEGCHLGALHVYRNSTRLDGVETDTWGDWYETYFKPEDGDVFRFYPKGEPRRYGISFDVDASAAGSVVMADHITPVSDLGSVYMAFEGQEFAIRPAEDVTVMADDIVLAPGEDGVVVFAPEKDCTLRLASKAGIGDVTVDSDGGSAPIYNMQGVMVGTDLDRLPAGFYIRNGVKIRK